MKELSCQRCGKEMYLIKTDKLQLGQTGFLLGDWPNLIAGALEVEIYGCQSCGKLEFFLPGFDDSDTAEEFDELPPEVNANIVGVSMHGVPQVKCPRCGRKHDFDYPKCIYCDHDYSE